MQVPNGTEPGVPRSKHPLSANHAHGNISEFDRNAKWGNKFKFRNKVMSLCNVWSMKGVIVYNRTPDCYLYVIFERSGLHIGE